MDEGELLALLHGVRKEPIRVCRLPWLARHALQSSTDLVLLSPQTVAKQEAKHHDPSLQLYRKAVAAIENGFIRKAGEHKVQFIYHEEILENGKKKTLSYIATVKTTTQRHENYLVSIHRARKNDVRKTFNRTKPIKMV